MASHHLPDTSPSWVDLRRANLERSGPALTAREHLQGMDTKTPAPVPDVFDVLSLAELADRLHVSAQTLYDLRKKGRGPRGFRVGPRLMFRMAEVESWLSAMEDADGQAQARRGGRP